MKHLARFAATVAAASLVACAHTPVPTPDTASAIARQAEEALRAGVRAYRDAHYDEAEARLQAALADGLVSAKDRANAHKHLAFIYCTSARMSECEAEFRRAREADPAFELDRSEAGHPLWGPVYRRLQR